MDRKITLSETFQNLEVNATLKQMMITWENFKTKLMKEYSWDIQQKEGITNFITND